MQRFIIEQGEADLTSHSGLALVGPALNEYTTLAKSVKQAIPQRHGVPHADVPKSFSIRHCGLGPCLPPRPCGNGSMVVTVP